MHSHKLSLRHPGSHSKPPATLDYTFENLCTLCKGKSRKEIMALFGTKYENFQAILARLSLLYFSNLTEITAHIVKDKNNEDRIKNLLDSLGSDDRKKLCDISKDFTDLEFVAFIDKFKDQAEAFSSLKAKKGNYDIFKLFGIKQKEYEDAKKRCQNNTRRIEETCNVTASEDDSLLQVNITRTSQSNFKIKLVSHNPKDKLLTCTIGEFYNSVMSSKYLSYLRDEYSAAPHIIDDIIKRLTFYLFGVAYDFKTCKSLVAPSLPEKIKNIKLIDFKYGFDELSLSALENAKGNANELNSQLNLKLDQSKINQLEHEINAQLAKKRLDIEVIVPECSEDESVIPITSTHVTSQQNSDVIEATTTLTSLPMLYFPVPLQYEIFSNIPEYPGTSSPPLIFESFDAPEDKLPATPLIQEDDSTPVVLDQLSTEIPVLQFPASSSSVEAIVPGFSENASVTPIPSIHIASHQNSDVVEDITTVISLSMPYSTEPLQYEIFSTIPEYPAPFSPTIIFEDFDALTDSSSVNTTIIQESDTTLGTSSVDPVLEEDVPTSINLKTKYKTTHKRISADHVVYKLDMDIVRKQVHDNSNNIPEAWQFFNGDMPIPIERYGDIRRVALPTSNGNGGYVLDFVRLKIKKTSERVNHKGSQIKVQSYLKTHPLPWKEVDKNDSSDIYVRAIQKVKRSQDAEGRNTKQANKRQKTQTGVREIQSPTTNTDTRTMNESSVQIPSNIPRVTQLSMFRPNVSNIEALSRQWSSSSFNLNALRIDQLDTVLSGIQDKQPNHNPTITQISNNRRTNI